MVVLARYDASSGCAVLPAASAHVFSEEHTSSNSLCIFVLSALFFKIGFEMLPANIEALRERLEDDPRVSFVELEWRSDPTSPGGGLWRWPLALSVALGGSLPPVDLATGRGYAFIVHCGLDEATGTTGASVGRRNAGPSLSGAIGAVQRVSGGSSAGASGGGGDGGGSGSDAEVDRVYRYAGRAAGGFGSLVPVARLDDALPAWVAEKEVRGFREAARGFREAARHNKRIAS